MVTMEMKGDNRCKMLMRYQACNNCLANISQDLDHYDCCVGLSVISQVGLKCQRIGIGHFSPKTALRLNCRGKLTFAVSVLMMQVGGITF